MTIKAIEVQSGGSFGCTNQHLERIYFVKLRQDWPFLRQWLS